MGFRCDTFRVVADIAARSWETEQGGGEATYTGNANSFFSSILRFGDILITSLGQVSGEDGDESSVRIVVPKGGNVEAQLKALADVKKEYQREQEREARKLRRKSRSGAEINLVRSDTYDGYVSFDYCKSCILP